MEYEYKPIPKVIEEREEYPNGANHPTQVKVYECFCKKGEIEYHSVSGFDDDWFVICCDECKKKYGYIGRCGSEWKVYRS